MLAVNEREDCIMASHLPIGPLKTTRGSNQYRDANPVPTGPLANYLATVPFKPIQLNI